MLDMQWHDVDVAWQGVIDAAPEMSVPYGVHVFVFNDLETLRRVRDRPGEQKSSAASLLYDEPDAGNTIAVIMLAADTLELSLVVHEATHVALHAYSLNLAPHATARAHIANHTEFLPEMIGNLAALVWHGIPEEMIANA